MVTGVPAAVLELEAGSTWTTSGGAAVAGVGRLLGVMVVPTWGASGGSTWFTKTWV